MVIDAYIIDEQNMEQLEKTITKSGIKLAPKNTTFFIMVEDNGAIKKAKKSTWSTGESISWTFSII